MAVSFAIGFDGQAVSIDQITLTGTAAYDTSVKRTGSASLRCNPASGAAGWSTGVLNGVNHFGLYIATLPSVDRVIAGTAGQLSLRLTSTGALAYYDNATLKGTSSFNLNTATWYWIGFLVVAATGTLLAINGVADITGTAAITNSLSGRIGCTGTEASALDIYFDDFVATNSASEFLAPSNVTMLLPASDNARTAGWVGGGGATTNLWDAVNNTPPVGVADTGTNTSQIRDATAEANAAYDANLTTYTAAGVGASDTVLAVQPIIATAAPVTTSSKQGTFGVVSNPAIADAALGAGGTAGAFWSGTTGGTYPTGWKITFGTFTASPSVTVGTAPVMRVTQVTSSTRIAMVCFMGMLMAWTPAAVAAAAVRPTALVVGQAIPASTQ